MIIQEILSDEVVIADDGSTLETGLIIKDYQIGFPTSLKHAWQEDKGFRVAKSRNNAIRKFSSEIEYIVMIDGDMILHPSFIKDHIKMALENTFFQGSRVLITEETTALLLRSKKIPSKINFFYRGILKRKNTIRSHFLS